MRSLPRPGIFEAILGDHRPGRPLIEVSVWVLGRISAPAKAACGDSWRASGIVGWSAAWVRLANCQTYFWCCST